MFNIFHIFSESLAAVKEVQTFGAADHTIFTHVIQEEQLAGKIISELTSFYFYNTTVHKFNLAISDNCLNAELLNNIALLLAHPQYERTSLGPVIFILNEVEATGSLMAEFLKSHGYQNKAIINLPASILKHVGVASVKGNEFNSFSALNLTGLDEFYYSYLAKDYAYQDKFLVNLASDTSVLEIFKAIERAIGRLSGSDKFLSSVIKDLHGNCKVNEHTGHLLEAKTKELEIMKALFEENAKNNEIEYILNFYHQEYEVLPLWFKRIGHIIKALTGKRSWKSLVNGAGK